MSNINFDNIIWGEKKISGNLKLETAERYITTGILKDKCKDIKKISSDSIINVLEKVGEQFLDKNSIYFKKCMELLPGELNYSPQMVEYGLTMFGNMLKYENIIQKIKCLGEYHVLDNFMYDNKRSSRVVPVGSVFHVASGNIFLGSVDSLIYGILTKNVNILKVSSQDFIFPRLFMEALIEADINKIITPYISIIYFSRNHKQVESYIKNICDAILLFGGEEAVINYKNGLSAKTEIYSFGPKLSFGLVCRGINDEEIKNAAYGFADDMILWEQKACTSCQNIFIEKDESNDKFIKYLNEALEEKAIFFPQCEVNIHESVDIRREREIAKWKTFINEGEVFEGINSNHTITVQESADILNSPLNRTVYINKVDSYKDIINGNSKNLKYYMSTLGLACKKGDTQKIVDEFITLGILRFSKPGTMGKGHDVAAAHDGVHIAELLTRKINIEDLDVDYFGTEFLDENEKDDILLSKINRLLMTAVKSPFYRELYKDIDLPMKSLDDFKMLPILEKSHLANNTDNSSMLTADNSNCYLFCAGGTTGKPKYIWYSNEEFYESQKLFGKGFRETGINERDFVVNYMTAGALWTGFLATNRGLEETGCRILSLTSNQSEEETIKYLQKFKPNVMISIPGNLILLAQKVKSMNLDITIEKMYYGGDHLPASAEEYLRNIFKCSEIHSMGYAAVETGPIGFQCKHCSGTEHHLFEDWCYVERDENGDALITVLGRMVHPIIRFRVGDRIEIVEEKCKCGRTSNKIKLLSRSDNTIKFNHSDLNISDVNDLISDYKELSSFFQIVIDTVKEELKVTFNIETKLELIDSKYMKVGREFKKNMTNNIRTLGENASLNLIKELEINVIPPKSIKRFSRTGKIRRVIDNRLE